MLDMGSASFGPTGTARASYPCWDAMRTVPWPSNRHGIAQKGINYIRLCMSWKGGNVEARAT